MKKLNPKLMKRLLIVVINSIGGLLIITGVIFLAVWGIQLLLAKEIVPYCLPISVIMILGGLHILYMVNKESLYPDKIRKMTEEEREIERLKSSLKISKYEFFFKILRIAFVIYCVVSIFYIYKGYKEIDTDISEQLNSMLSFEDSNDEFTTLLSRFYDYASRRIRLIIDFCKFAVFMLILVFFAFPRNIIPGDNKYKPELIISMWERIQQLESKVKELEAGAQVDGQ